MSGRCFRLAVGTEHAPAVEAMLRAEGYAFEPEPFHSAARRLTAEPAPLGRSLAAHFGLIYIQDRSSMLPPLALCPPPGARVLDACASPGSKTGMLARMVGPGGLVLGVEPATARLNVLRANLRRAGVVNVATARAEAQRLPFESAWTHILLDAPCSGWGTEDKNPGVRESWIGRKTGPLEDLQRELLAAAARMLAPGGVLVYSTCTTNERENEDQVRFAIRELGLIADPLDPPSGFALEPPRGTGAEGCLRVAEDADGQGFFVARLLRPGQAADQGECADPADPPGQPFDPARAVCKARVAWGGLPGGELREFRGRVVFLPRAALCALPSGLAWQGASVGRLSGGRERFFRPDATARALLPDSPGPDDANLDDPAQLRALVSGQGLAAGSGSGMAGLYFRGMPLGWLARKGRRLIWSDQG